ncbi:unnamed protein product [Thelazia callipaeda]|uniref:Aamy domain-containing protein n=1 Tax=Thelazia callipaeda TaxID=103827 RepID=A0A0N5CZE9_THECL|nr:unnamed protein product [Thelazia callipaeda]
MNEDRDASEILPNHDFNRISGLNYLSRHDYGIYYPGYASDGPGVLRFGKRGQEKKNVPGVLRFGKRDDDIPGVLRFGKRPVPGVLRFG